nr:MAG TPA: hypothetical protein [Caudoviricetes sp.]
MDYNELKRTMKSIQNTLSIITTYGATPIGHAVLCDDDCRLIIARKQDVYVKCFWILHGDICLLENDPSTKEKVKEDMFSIWDMLVNISPVEEFVSDDPFGEILYKSILTFSNFLDSFIIQEYDLNLDHDLIEYGLESMIKIRNNAPSIKLKDGTSAIIAKMKLHQDQTNEDLLTEEMVYSILGMKEDEFVAQEAYIGKTKNLLLAESILQDLIDLMRANPSLDVTNHPLASKFEAALKAEFGFSDVIIHWVRSDVVMSMLQMDPINDDYKTIPRKIAKNTMNTFNIYTCPSVEIVFNSTSRYLRPFKKKTNERYYDKSHENVCMVQISYAFILNTDVTAAETLAVILHEIGHNFDNSPYNAFASIVKFYDLILSGIKTTDLNITAANNLNELADPKTAQIVANVNAIFASKFLHYTNIGHEIKDKLDHVFASLADKIPFIKKIMASYGMLEYAAQDIYFYTRNLRTIVDNTILIGKLFALTAIGIGKSILSVSPKLFAEYAQYFGPIYLELYAGKIITKKGEIFADTFAATYGYGPELITALQKMDLSQAPVASKITAKYPVTSFLLDIQLACGHIIASILNPDHGSSTERADKVMKHLRKELASLDLDSRTKKELESQLSSLENRVNSLVKSSVENHLYFTAAIQWITLKLFHGNMFIVEKLFPDVRA